MLRQGAGPGTTDPGFEKPRGVIHPRVQKVGPEHFVEVTPWSAMAAAEPMPDETEGNLAVPQLVESRQRRQLDAVMRDLGRRHEHGGKGHCRIKITSFGGRTADILKERGGNR